MESINLVETQSNKKLFKGTMIGYLNLILTIVSGLVFTPWIIRTISTSSYGLYTLSSSLVSLFLFDFGLSSAINSFLSKFRARNDVDSINKTISTVYKLYLIFDIVLIVAFTTCYFLIDFIYKGLTIEEKSSLKTIFIVTAIFSLISFPATSVNGVIQSYEEFGTLKLIDLLNKLLYIVLSAGCLIFNLGLFSLVVANCFAGLVSILLKYMVLAFKLKLRLHIFSRFDFQILKTVLSYSLWAALNSLSARLIFNIMPSILGVVSDSSNVAVFSVGAAIEGYIYSFATIMNGFFLPKLARCREQPNARELIDNLAIKVGKIQLFLIGLVFVGFISCGKEFINLWMKYDTTFETAYYGTVIITITQLVFIPNLIFYTELFADKETTKQLAIVSLIKAGLNLGLGFVLCKFFGASGAFVSIFICRVFEVSGHNYLYKRKLGADLSRYYRLVFLPFIPAIVTSLFVGLLAHFTIPHTVLFETFIKIGLIVTFTYIVISFIYSFKKEDINSFLGVIKLRRK